MFSTFDLCLLLYVIRLAGWLKHCNLSLSLSLGGNEHVLGRFAGGQHVARANGVCTHCGSVAVADELHMIFECPALQAVRQRYAPLFSTDTNTMRSFFAQQDHMQVLKFVLDCLDVFHI